MKNRIFVWTAVAALMLPRLLAAENGATADIQVDPQGLHAKKYVAFGWEYAYMLPEYFISHVAEFEKTALDGIGFYINGDKAAGRRYQCFREIMQAPRWTKESLANLVGPCRRMTALKPFRESFVRSMVRHRCARIRVDLVSAQGRCGWASPAGGKFVHGRSEGANSPGRLL